MKDRCIEMNIKQNGRIKVRQTNIDIFSYKICRCQQIVSFDLFKDGKAKRYRARRYYLPKGIIKNYNVSINGEAFYDQPIISNDMKKKEN